MNPAAHAKAFPWRSLDTTTHAEARAFAEVRRWAAQNVSLSRLASAFSDVLDAPVRFIVLRAAPVHEARPLAGGAAVAIARADAPELDRAVVVEAEAALLAALTARVLQRSPPRVVVSAALTSSAASGVLAAIVAAALRRAHQGVALRVLAAGPATVLEADVAKLGQELIGVTATVLVGDEAYEARVVAPRRALLAAADIPWDAAAVASLGYDRDFATVPRSGPHLVGSRRAAPGWWRVEVDPLRRSVRLPEGVLLDLGSTAKALCADRSAARIADAIGCGVLVSLGGDVSIAGPLAGSGWSVGVALDCATPPEAAPVTVLLASGGLASSGTTVRSWRRGGRLLHHIVDPGTGDVTMSPFDLVSVAGPTCVDANAISTAAVVWGTGAPERVEASGLPARLQQRNGVALVVDGWPADAGVHRPGRGEA